MDYIINWRHKVIKFNIKNAIFIVFILRPTHLTFDPACGISKTVGLKLVLRAIRAFAYRLTKLYTSMAPGPYFNVCVFHRYGFVFVFELQALPLPFYSCKLLRMASRTLKASIKLYISSHAHVKFLKNYSLPLFKSTQCVAYFILYLFLFYFFLKCIKDFNKVLIIMYS